jgi:hypothetical protein
MGWSLGDAWSAELGDGRPKDLTEQCKGREAMGGAGSPCAIDDSVETVLMLQPQPGGLHAALIH